MSSGKKEQRLENFQVNHHETLHQSYKAKMEWWRNETDVEKRRCKVCWLRVHQCYCDVLNEKRAKYEAWAPKPDINVCIYYNSIEIARTANTAHSLEATCPWICNSIVYGDFESEKALLDDMEAEHRENRPQTCIMFPSKDAKLLSEWMGARPVEHSDKPIRLVMLDGTFPGASRQAKYLMNCCAVRGIPAPLVKLDLEGDACKSAVAGMMYQPGKDKICTYQAMVMAMKQAGVDPLFCESLDRDLADWIGYILKHKVKLGKSKPRQSMMHEMDVAPSEVVAEAMKQKAASHATGQDLLKHSQHNSNLHKKTGKNNAHVRTNSTTNSFLDDKYAVEYTRRFSVYRLLSTVQI